MNSSHPYLPGNVLPTVLVVSVVMLTGLLGLMTLWEQEMLLFARGRRLQQARADIESAYTLWRLHPDLAALTASEGHQLYDSLPQSRVFIRQEPWGLYDAVQVVTSDSLVHACRLYGAESDTENTLWYADNRSAVTLAGQSVLHGVLHLPQNGLVYGRVGSDFYRGQQIPRTSIRRSGRSLPAPTKNAEARVATLFAEKSHFCKSLQSIIVCSTIHLLYAQSDTADIKYVLHTTKLQRKYPCLLYSALIL